MSIHLDEQKLPPMGDDLVFRSASVVPMLSSDWQAELDPEDAAQDPDENLFRWDGKFVANPKAEGTWKLVAEVVEIADFDPAKKARHVRNAPFSTITLEDGGRTSEPTWAWSGEILMDLGRYQALEMRWRQVGDAEYVFVEAGGFSKRHKPGWKSRWLVLASVDRSS